MPARIDLSEDGVHVDSATVFERLIDLLQEVPLCSISSSTADDLPHIHTAFFVYEDGHIYFWSSKNTQHSKNISRSSSIAVTVFATSQRWGEDLRGCQLFGHCQALEGGASAEASRLYSERFTVYGAYLRSTEYVNDPDMAFYCLTLERGVLLDEVTFGEDRYVAFQFRQDESG